MSAVAGKPVEVLQTPVTKRDNLVRVIHQGKELFRETMDVTEVYDWLIKVLTNPNL